MNKENIPDEFILEARRLVHSKGYQYLKDIAETMANGLESPTPWTAEGKEKLFQAALFRKTIRGLWAQYEKLAELEVGRNSDERALANAIVTEEVIEGPKK